MNAGAAGKFLFATHQFLDQVLRLQPRVAAFDCDGTLWSGDAGESFFSWELSQRELFPEDFGPPMRQRYAAYKRGEVDETTMCGEMVTMHRGLTEAKVMEAALCFFEESIAPQIFPEMRELIGCLRENGCEVWAVSSSNEWVIRAGMIHLGIPESHALAAKAEIASGIITDRLVRVPSGPGKPLALRDAGAKQIDAAFGNSLWDSEILAMAKHAFAINPNPDLEMVARERGWDIYFPESTGSRHLEKPRTTEGP